MSVRDFTVYRYSYPGWELYCQIIKVVSCDAVARICCFMQVATAASLCLWNGWVR